MGKITVKVKKLDVLESYRWQKMSERCEHNTKENKRCTSTARYEVVLKDESSEMKMTVCEQHMKMLKKKEM
jgi:hypothetical protein